MILWRGKGAQYEKYIDGKRRRRPIVCSEDSGDERVHPLLSRCVPLCTPHTHTEAYIHLNVYIYLLCGW